MPWARFHEIERSPTEERTAAAPTSITRNAGLAFTPGEPACNVYTSGGQFTPHQDGQSLTVIVVLTDKDTFVGGGNRFCSKASPNPRVRLRRPEACSGAGGERGPRKANWPRLSRLAFDLGTSFWAATESLPLKGAARDHAGRAPGPAALHVSPQCAPAFVLTPPAGMALVSNPRPNAARSLTVA
jgi:hypothetical protein